MHLRVELVLQCRCGSREFIERMLMILDFTAP